MATSVDYIEFVMDSVNRAEIEGIEFRYHKMFGEYCVYANDKPIMLVCNDTVYVKMLDCIIGIMNHSMTGYPYTGSKLYYILDIEDLSLLHNVVIELEANTAIPKKKKTTKV